MKNLYKKLNRSQLSLGELVAAVSSCAKNSKETLATLADLFESGRVRVQANGRLKRVRIGV
jgi:hypothetical protein